MIWGAPIGVNLEMDADELVDWRQDRSIIDDPKELLLALFALWVTQRLEQVPLTVSVAQPDDPMTLLHAACVEWLRTGQLAADGGTDILDKVPLTEDTDDEIREALLVLAVLNGDERQVHDLRRHMFGLRSENWEIGPSEGLVEMLFLTQPEVRDAWGKDRHVRQGWMFRLCSKVNRRKCAAPLFALGIHYCTACGLDVLTVVRDAIRALDENIYLSPSEARLVTDDLELTAIRRPSPGLEAPLRVQGSGGRIDGGLPMVLDESVYGLPWYLMRIMAGEAPVSYVDRARSKKDVPALLSRDGSLVTIKIKLDDDLSIEADDLNAYRWRVQCGLDWVKGCFPDVQANAAMVLAE